MNGERVRFAVQPPPDRMVPDRLRRFARRLLLAARTPVLLASGLFRRRSSVPPPPARVGRILVVRTDRLGDMALTAAALLDLREHFRGATITVLAPAAPLALLESHPAVDRRVVLDRGGLPREMIGAFDLAIDFTPDENLRGAFLVARTRAPLRIGFAAAGRQALFSLRGPRADPARHLVDLHRDLLVSLGIAPRDRGVSLFVSPDERGAVIACYYALAYLGFATPYLAAGLGALAGKTGAFVALTAIITVLALWTAAYAASLRRSAGRPEGDAFVRSSRRNCDSVSRQGNTPARSG